MKHCTRFLLSGDTYDALVGNAPLFVPRNGAPPEFISYHRPTAESISAFLSCGDSGGEAIAEIEVAGRGQHAVRLEAIRALRQGSPLSLAELKDLLDQCFEGRSVRVQTCSVASGRELVTHLLALNFDAQVLYRTPSKS